MTGSQEGQIGVPWSAGTLILKKCKGTCSDPKSSVLQEVKVMVGFEGGDIDRAGTQRRLFQWQKYSVPGSRDGDTYWKFIKPNCEAGCTLLYLRDTSINKNIKRKKGTGERKPSSGTVKGKGQRTISLQIDGENVLLNMKSRAEVSRHELLLGRLPDSHTAHASGAP